MPEATVEGVEGNKLTEDFCKNMFTAFGDRDRFNEVGGWSSFNSALSKPWVLVMSVWDDVREGSQSSTHPISV
jgi:cellulose 1,4-beta-cellobiosidase